MSRLQSYLVPYQVTLTLLNWEAWARLRPLLGREILNVLTRTSPVSLSRRGRIRTQLPQPSGPKLSDTALGVFLVLFLGLFLGCTQTTKRIMSQADTDPVDPEETSFVDTKIRKYTQLSRDFPEEPKYQERLARLYWEKRDHHQALRHLGKARKIDPGNPKYDFIEGRIHIGISNFNGAEKAYRRMIEHTPKGFPGPHYELGWFYLGLGRRAEAEEQFQTCLAIDKSLAAPHYFLGQIAFDAKDEKKAIEHFETYLRLGGGPRHQEVLVKLRALQPELYTLKP